MVSQSGPYLVDFRRGKPFHIVDVDKKGEFILEPVKWKFVSNDLFAEKECFFTEDQLQEAMHTAEKLFFEWISKRCDTRD